ncbi:MULTISPECIES: porin family protein [Flavobacterium]|uniref:porin family protein n=1 Tax=Flavobacterium TaxID=237 RepID=UPI001FCC2D48|nr:MULTISPECIES: porin family protein [Flavobacterium]UOK42940.1 PorT family protein [Flavobacterium enshiense]
MKKLFATVLLCFFGLAQMNAQVTVKPGLKGGATFSKFTNTNSDFVTDFYVGAFAAIKLAKFYTLQPELLYTAQGSEVRHRNFDPMNGLNTFSEKKYSLDYLSMSVVNKFSFGHGFEAVVGPTLDFQVGDNFEWPLSEDLIGFDMGIVGGIGYSLPNGLTFEARYKQGFIDIFGAEYYDEYDVDGNGNFDDIYLNQVFQLGISYTFDVKQK